MMPTIHRHNILIQLTILVMFLANTRLTIAATPRPPPRFRPETFYCSSTDSDRAVGICVDWHGQAANIGRAGHINNNKNVFKWCSTENKDPRRSYCCIPRVGWWADEGLSVQAHNIKSNCIERTYNS
ncbi:hypothetical protein PGT21_009995 [Puccinia graminis f. sp. tritici]|uniref:Uncharacterized protein n=1 Tax=Puccinia graminis f. sp. tritici TaxID=56615 RepID=A0A5B0Q2I6_PUCGR|nr:hypothetical protein PGT21_009995 [Puccinia graminis f. sp. tritici]KAA1124899.1 hypothetical protein PGTUg99_036509 [Puccinia graminis f. sp. tritici]